MFPQKPCELTNTGKQTHNKNDSATETVQAQKKRQFRAVDANQTKLCIKYVCGRVGSYVRKMDRVLLWIFVVAF